MRHPPGRTASVIVEHPFERERELATIIEDQNRTVCHARDATRLRPPRLASPSGLLQGMLTTARVLVGLSGAAQSWSRTVSSWLPLVGPKLVGDAGRYDNADAGAHWAFVVTQAHSSAPTS